MPPKFNERATSYLQAAVVQQHLASWLAQWLEPLEKTSLLTALELGPGDGLFTKYIATRFRNLSAIDVAPRMVERGRRMLPKVEWRVGDGWHLDAPSVYRIYSSSFLQWCDNPVAVLRRWHALAKSDGRMLHGFYVAPTLTDWQSVSLTPSPINWRSPKQWLDLFREAGWSVLRSESRIHVQRFASALELVRFFHRTGAITSSCTSVSQLRQMIFSYDEKFASEKDSSSVTSSWTFFRIEVAK